MIRATMLQELVEQITGMHLTAATVTRAASKRIAMLGDVPRDCYAARVAADKDELAALVELLVVPETWLFRDPGAFAAAAAFALARQRTVQRRLRILSLPCATGEEPYSLAMALLDAGMDATQFSIDGIDISSVALERAGSATYGRNAFRNPDTAFRDRYFTPDEHGERLRPDVQALVRFRQGNLLDLDPAIATPAFDIIFCRNLLIYFEESMQQRALTILNRLLDDQGMLFSGYAEFPVFLRHGFVSAQLSGAFAVCKATSTQDTIAPPARRPTPPVHRVSLPVATAPLHRTTTSSAQVVPEAQTASAASAATADLLASARSLADRGALDAALKNLQACLARAPDLAQAHAMLGAIHARKGDPVAAEVALRHALYLEPNDYQVLCQLALLADQQGDRARAAALRARAGRVFDRTTLQ